MDRHLPRSGESREVIDDVLQEIGAGYPLVAYVPADPGEGTADGDTGEERMESEIDGAILAGLVSP
jgi:hypothetical protein